MWFAATVRGSGGDCKLTPDKNTSQLASHVLVHGQRPSGDVNLSCGSRPTPEECGQWLRNQDGPFASLLDILLILQLICERHITEVFTNVIT